MDIDIAHQAIIHHYGLATANGKPDSIKPIKMPKSLYSLIQSEEIVDFINKCRTESLALSIASDSSYTKFAYNNINPRVVDYAM